MPMHLRHVAYGGCWKCPQLWQCCSSTTPRLAASQNGLVHSFGRGIGRVTLLQALLLIVGVSRSSSPAAAMNASCKGYLPEHLLARIDVDCRAGDRARALRAQEGDGECEFVRTRLALDRVPCLGTLGAELGRHARMGLVVAHGIHEARVHVIDRDPVWAKSSGKRLCRRAQCSLGG